VNKIGSSGYFKFTGAPASYAEALALIGREKADLILEIPSGFERNLVREGSQPLGISVDAINASKAGIGAAYLGQVIADFNARIDMNVKNAAPPASGVIDITFTNWFNPRAEYKYNVVPAVLVLLLTLIGGFMTALNIVREKEIGTIEQINVTPIKKWEFILGKLIPFWVIGMVVFTIGLCVSYLVYGIYPRGNLLLLYLFAVVYLIDLLGFGLLISTYSNSQVQAMFIAFFFMVIFMLMSGFFTSIDSMPHWARIMSELTPVTHFVRVDRMIILKGSGWNEVKQELVYLLCFGVVFNGWAIWNYRKTN
jgi:ABC-2 type transport system permease protein